jgi:hypothetical protein
VNLWALAVIGRCRVGERKSGFPGCTGELARVAKGIWWIWSSVKALSQVSTEPEY